MNDGKVAWTGNFPAVITPFTAAGEIDEKKFLENIEILVADGVDGIIVSGSNGESWALEPDERLRLFAIAAQLIKGRVPVLGGTGGIITKRVAELTLAAKEAGCDGAMIMPPYYAMVNRKEVAQHYRTISETAKLPILLYNSPAATGVELNADFCVELAEIDYVVAIKQSVPRLRRIREHGRRRGRAHPSLHRQLRQARPRRRHGRRRRLRLERGPPRHGSRGRLVVEGLAKR